MSAAHRPSDAVLANFAAIVGSRHVLSDTTDTQRYVIERRGLFHGKAALVLRPGDTGEVAQIMKLASQTGSAIVPQGGNTGLVGGQIPTDDGSQIIVSLERLTRVRDIDAANNTLTVEAGVTLQNVQEQAAGVDRLFPLSLASQGTCQIGGNIATNAGGTAVLAYGNTRDLVLGLEVVLANGQIWSGLKTLRKDNAGYDLRQLFIGSEGTLGIITAACLKLFARPRAQATALVGVPHPTAAVELLHLAQAGAATVTGFEIISSIGMEFVLAHGPGTRAPLGAPSPWYVLVEMSSGGTQEDCSSALQDVLEQGIKDGLVDDAVLAASLAQANELWRLRMLLSEVQSAEGGSIKHDISVPISQIAQFIERASAAACQVVPGARPVPFGHLGDGNLHFNISQPPAMDKAAFLARWADVNAAVHAVVLEMGGSISAEHGVGQLKRDLVAQTGDPVGLGLMRDLKRALDPHNILNPGKVVKVDE
ncbi:MAG: FAD-binding oxidoreductase [Alphaproteobacteria bacterium]